MLLKFRPFCGPIEYKFKDPDTGFLYKANSEAELYSRIRLYRQQNQLETIEFLEATVEHYLCRQPENTGACQPRGDLKRGVFQYLRGGLMLLKSMLYSSFVSQEVADSRADICVQCPKNVFPDRGRFIKWSDSIAEASVENRKVKHYNELGNCEVCSCTLKAKTWYTGPFKATEKEMSEYPDFCWQKKEIQKRA